MTMKMITSPVAHDGAASSRVERPLEGEPERHKNHARLIARPKLAWQEATGAIAGASREPHLEATTGLEATEAGVQTPQVSQSLRSRTVDQVFKM